jgi:hypothetical protein
MSARTAAARKIFDEATAKLREEEIAMRKAEKSWNKAKEKARIARLEWEFEAACDDYEAERNTGGELARPEQPPVSG